MARPIKYRVTMSDNKQWRFKWADENSAYIDAHTLEEGLVKMFTDAQQAGVKKLEFPVMQAAIVCAAVDRCQPWARWESWGPFHLWVHIAEPS